MATDVHRHRKSGNMGRKRFDMDAQGGCIPAKPLRANPQGVDLVQHPLLELCIKRVLVGFRNRTAQGHLRQQRALFKVAADSHAEHHRRAGIAPCDARRLHHKADNVVQRSGRGEHLYAAHIFAAKSLGCDH